MPINVRVLDSTGTNSGLKVNSENEIPVVVHPHPPIGENITGDPFRQYFTDDGFSTGSNDMVVDGSSTAVDFWINASEDYDLYIKVVSVEVGDGGSPNLNSFGALSALTNGVQLFHFTQSQGLYTLHEGLKTNKSLHRLGRSNNSGFGDGTTAFLADVSGGVSEKSYLPVINFSDIYGFQYGLRLKKGTTDKLIFRIQDNMTGLITFNAIATGMRI